MADYKQKDGRLQDEKGNWVWNGESYEFVQSHTDWLPLSFKSQSDAAKFERLEKIWKAEQILKNPSSSVAERKTAQKILNSLGATVKHDDMADSMSYTYLYHSGKGKERAGHKYSFREWAGDGWRYFYEKSGLKAKKEYEDAVEKRERAKAAHDRALKYLNEDLLVNTGSHYDDQGRKWQEYDSKVSIYDKEYKDAKKRYEEKSKNNYIFNNEAEAIDHIIRLRDLDKDVTKAKQNVKRASEQEQEHRDRWRFYNDRAQKAADEVTDKLRKYRNTPIGRLKDDIDDTIDYISKLLSKLK